MTSNMLVNYLSGKALIAVGTSPARIAMHLCISRELFPKTASGDSGVPLKLLDLGPDLDDVHPLFCADEQPLWLTGWRGYPQGASRVPPVASLLFSKTKKELENEDKWPNGQGNNIFLINLSGGTGGGVAPEIVALAPKGTKQWGIVNATLDDDIRQVTNFCYNFPRVNLGAEWKWDAEQKAWAPIQETCDTPCYRGLFLFDAASIEEKFASGLITDLHEAELRNELLQQAIARQKSSDLATKAKAAILDMPRRHFFCNEFVSRFVEMVVLAERDLPNTLGVLAAGGTSCVGTFVVPCLWPLNTDYEEDLDNYGVIDYVLRAVRVGAMCPGVNPEEATAAVVLLQGPRRILDGIETKVQQQLAALLKLSPGVIKVTPIPRSLEDSESNNRLRVCVLLMTPSFGTIRSLYAEPAKSLDTLRRGTDAWLFELRGAPGIPGVTAKELQDEMKTQADPELIQLKFNKWFEMVKSKAEQAKKSSRIAHDGVFAWGKEPDPRWKESVDEEIQNIQNERKQDHRRSSIGYGESEAIKLPRP